MPLVVNDPNHNPQQIYAPQNMLTSLTDRLPVIFPLYSPGPFPLTLHHNLMLLEQGEIPLEELLRVGKLGLQDLAVSRTPQRELTLIRIGPRVEAVGVVEGVVDDALDRLDVEAPQDAGEGDEQVVAGELGARADAAAPAEARVAKFAGMGLAALFGGCARHVLFG